ncbi:MAG: hypothetical protein AAF914_07940 [Pseudomonadota bacterium]
MTGVRFSLASFAAATALAGVTLATAGPALAEASPEDAPALQVAMQRHIDRVTIDGAFLVIDPDTGALREYFPINAHPMILTGGGHVVVCADVQDHDGNRYPVDFYMIETDRGWRVFHTAIDDRAQLRALIAAGVYTRL